MTVRITTGWLGARALVCVLRQAWYCILCSLSLSLSTLAVCVCVCLLVVSPTRWLRLPARNLHRGTTSDDRLWSNHAGRVWALKVVAAGSSFVEV
jgi:hypothetical protein